MLSRPGPAIYAGANWPPNCRERRWSLWSGGAVPYPWGSPVFWDELHAARRKCRLNSGDGPRLTPKSSFQARDRVAVNARPFAQLSNGPTESGARHA